MGRNTSPICSMLPHFGQATGGQLPSWQGSTWPYMDGHGGRGPLDTHHMVGLRGEEKVVTTGQANKSNRDSYSQTLSPTAPRAASLIWPFFTALTPFCLAILGLCPVVLLGNLETKWATKKRNYTLFWFSTSDILLTISKCATTCYLTVINL